MSVKKFLIILKFQLILLYDTSPCNGTTSRAAQQPPSNGLYFMLKDNVYVSGDSIHITDIGQASYDRYDPGSTLVCVTTHVNMQCCRSSDNSFQGALGQWYYPNGTVVGALAESQSIYRVRYTHQLRLAIANPEGPLGVYSCAIPDGTTGAIVIATINITAPIPTGFLIISPVMTDFYSGLRLNITCVVQVYLISNTVDEVIIDRSWIESSSPLSNNSQRYTTAPRKINSTIYQTSLIFHSLDKTADEGNYTCVAQVNVSYENYPLIMKKIVLSQQVAISTRFFQLRLSGLSNCQEWRGLNAATKNADILSAVVEFMQNNCDCDFTLDRLTDGAFLCDPTSLQSVIYQAQLHGTRQATTTELAEDLQNWAMSGSTVVVHFTVLTITNLCFLQSLSPRASCEEKSSILTTIKNELPRGASSAVIGVSVTIPIFLLLAVVVIILVVILILMKRLRKHNANATAESKSSAPAAGSADDPPQYEEVDKNAVRSFITDNISSNVCPAYDNSGPETLYDGNEKMETTECVADYV